MKILGRFSVILVFLSLLTMNVSGRKPSVSWWLTSPSSGVLFQEQSSSLNFVKKISADPVIEVDENQTFQTIDGFGNCLTDGSAMLLH